MVKDGSNPVQDFLVEELIQHAQTKGFAFLLDQNELLAKLVDRFNLTKSKAVWEMNVFIQNNAGPNGDLAVIEKDGHRFFQWRYVNWPSWLPRFVKKPRWHRDKIRERYQA